MKRIFLVVAMIVLVLSLVGCGSDTKKSETITSSNETVGSYSLFQTDDVDEYLNFLENFDEDQYEIVNIDTFVRKTAFNYNDDYYMITYKKIK